MKHVVTTVVFSVVAGMSSLAVAQSGDHTSHHALAAETSAAAALTDGEVRKIDKEAKKLTLRHGPITNLEMPGMTMVFQVKDSALLEPLKVGDKVKFAADKVGGAFMVTRIEPVN